MFRSFVLAAALLTPSLAYAQAVVPVPAPDLERVINFLGADASRVALEIRQLLLNDYIAAQKAAAQAQAPAPAAADPPK